MSRALLFYEAAVVAVFAALWLWLNSLGRLEGEPPFMFTIAEFLCIPGNLAVVVFGPGVHSGAALSASAIYNAVIYGSVPFVVRGIRALRAIKPESPV